MRHSQSSAFAALCSTYILHTDNYITYFIYIHNYSVLHIQMLCKVTSAWKLFFRRTIAWLSPGFFRRLILFQKLTWYYGVNFCGLPTYRRFTPLPYVMCGLHLLIVYVNLHCQIYISCNTFMQHASFLACAIVVFPLYFHLSICSQMSPDHRVIGLPTGRLLCIPATRLIESHLDAAVSSKVLFTDSEGTEFQQGRLLFTGGTFLVVNV